MDAVVVASGRTDIAFAGRTFTFAGRLGDAYFDNLAQHATVDESIEIAARFLAEDAVVFDIGANLGLTTLAFAAIAPRGTVYSFEPVPRTFRYLQENIRANSTVERPIAAIEAINAACGAEDGKTRIFEDAYSAGSFIATEQTDDVQQLAVDAEILSIDTFVKRRRLRRVDFVKIDVEGFELSVLEGMRNTLREFAPFVILEFNSYCLIVNAYTLPNVFLEKLCGIFEDVLVLDKDRTPRLSSSGERRAALAANLTSHGCVDNLLAIPANAKNRAALLEEGAVRGDPVFARRHSESDGIELRFSEAFSGTGWNPRDTWGCWTSTPTATLQLDLSGMSGDCEILLWATAPVIPGQTSLLVSLSVNGQRLAAWPVTAELGEPYRARVPEAVRSRAKIAEITFACTVPGEAESAYALIAVRRMEVNPVERT